MKSIKYFAPVILMPYEQCQACLGVSMTRNSHLPMLQRDYCELMVTRYTRRESFITNNVLLHPSQSIL